MDTNELSRYFQIIRRWWWVTALLFSITLGVLVTTAILNKPQFAATVTVQVSAPAPQEVPLYSDYGRQALGDEIQRTRSSFGEFLLEGNVPGIMANELPELITSGSDFRTRISLESPTDSQLMRVKVTDANAETAALLANRLAEIGLQQYGELLAQSTINTRKFIEQQLEDARIELLDAETALAQFQIDNKFGDLGSALRTQYDHISALKVQSDLATVDGDPARGNALDSIIVSREAELQTTIGLSAEYTQLNDRVSRARDTYSFLLDKDAEAQIKENQLLNVSFIQIITPARAPRNPVSVVDAKLIVLGAVASILAGVLLTFLLEYLRVNSALRNVRIAAERPEVVGTARANR